MKASHLPAALIPRQPGRTHRGPEGGIGGFDLNDLLSQGGNSCAAPP